MLRYAMAVTPAYRARFRSGAGRAASATTSVRGAGLGATSEDVAAVVLALHDIRDSQARAARWTRASSVAIVTMAGATLLGGLFAAVRALNRSRLARR